MAGAHVQVADRSLDGCPVRLRGSDRIGVIDRRRRDTRTWRLTAPTDVRLRPSGPIGDTYSDLLLTEDRDDGLAERRYVVLGVRRRPPERLAALEGRGFVIE